MSELKTTKNTASVSAFINAIEDKHKRADAKKIMSMMRAATGKRAAMWGSSIVGFGSYRYTYASGRQNVWMQVGFSPRKQNLSLYIMSGFSDFDSLLKKLGKYRTGKSCLYINRLDDVDEGVLQELINRSVSYIRAKYRSGADN